MDKPALLGVARRRWYLLLLGLIASMALGYGAMAISPPQHTARALVMLLPPTATVEESGNPFLSLSNLDLPARVVVASVSSTSVRDEVSKQHPDIDYTIAMEESTRGPVIAVDVAGPSEQETLETLPTLIDQTLATLERLQNEVDAPTNDSVRAMLLTQDSSTTVDNGGTVRVGIAGVMLGLVVTVIAASAIDGRALARRSRRSPDPRGEPEWPGSTTTPLAATDAVVEPEAGHAPAPAAPDEGPEDPEPQPTTAPVHAGSVNKVGETVRTAAPARRDAIPGGTGGRSRGKATRPRKSR